MHKGLKIIFFLLLFITIGELIFYIYYKSSLNLKNPSSSSVSVVVSSPTLEVRDTLPTGPITTPFIYKTNVWDLLSKRDITDDHRITVQIDNIGTVVEAIPDYSDSFDRTADLYLSIRYNKGSGPGMLFLEKDNLKIYSVSEDGQRKEASISDIKPGDKINYQEIINITDEQSDIENYKYAYNIEIYK